MQSKRSLAQVLCWMLQTGNFSFWLEERKAVKFKRICRGVGKDGEVLTVANKTLELVRQEKNLNVHVNPAPDGLDFLEKPAGSLDRKSTNRKTQSQVTEGEPALKVLKKDASPPRNAVKPSSIAADVLTPGINPGGKSPDPYGGLPPLWKDMKVPDDAWGPCIWSCGRFRYPHWKKPKCCKRCNGSRPPVHDPECDNLYERRYLNLDLDDSED